MRGRAPVLSLCRKLIQAGHDPTEPAEAYRGSTLCLHIRSIGEAAELSIPHTPAGDRVGGMVPEFSLDPEDETEEA
jgi:hypothetical protein